MSKAVLSTAVATLLVALVFAVGGLAWTLAAGDNPQMRCHQNVAFAVTRGGIARVPDWDWRCH